MALIKDFYMRHPWVTVALALIIAGLVWWYWGSRDAETEITTATVMHRTVFQLVSVTGTVKPASNVNLSFEKGGRIAYVYRNVGDRVGIGESLVALQSGDISAQLAQARANAKVQVARLVELKNGARPEDILISEVDVENAKLDVISGIKSGYVNSDDAIRNKMDQMMSNPRTTNPQFNYTLNDSQLKIDIQNVRQTTESMLVSWNGKLAVLDSAQNILPYAVEAKSNLQAIQSY